MTTPRKDTVWQAADLVANYLEIRRRAIPLADLQIEVMLRLLWALERPVTRYLDLGCGDGILAAAIHAAFPAAHGVLQDFSAPMLDAARARFAGAAGVEFVLGDYATPAWVDAVGGPFDAVVSGFSIHHQPDARKRALYGKVHDLLAPGGLFVNIEHVSSESPWLEAVWEAYYIDYQAAHQPEHTHAEVAAAYRARNDADANILAPLDTQLAWLRDLGYTDVTCACKIFEMVAFSGRRPA